MVPDLAQLELHMAREHELSRALAVEWNFRRHWTLGADPAQGNLQGFHRMGDRVLNGGGFITPVDHPIRAFPVISLALRIPLPILPHLSQALRQPPPRHL